MLDSILPPRADNAFRGQTPALWLLGLVLLMRVVMSVNSILNSYAIAQSADGIPLATYPPAAAATIVAIFTLLGYGMFVLCLVGLVVLVRYRVLVPFMYVLLLVAQLGNRLLLAWKPIERTGPAPGVYVNWILLALLVAGLGLSLWRRGSERI